MPRITVTERFHEDPGAPLFDHAPEIARSAIAFSSTVYQELRLPHRVIEAARYRTAQINGCVTCQTWRAARHLPTYLEKVGGEAERSFVGRGDPAPDEAFYAAVEDWRTATIFSERERLAIEYAERMGTAPRSFDQDEPFWERMHAAFEDREIVELTFAVASWMALGRTLHVLDMDPKTCDVPMAAPAEQAAA